MRSACDPELDLRQRELYYESVRAEFIRREELRRKRFEESPAAGREPSTRSPEEVAKLKARLLGLDSETAPARRNVVDLDD
jgi:hypothetical protein